MRRLSWDRRTISLTLVATGILVLVVSIAISWRRPHLGASLPLVGAGVLMCLVGLAVQGVRGLGHVLMIVGTLAGLAAVIWFTGVMYSENYPPPLFWPAYALGLAAAVLLVVGAVIGFGRRRAQAEPEEEPSQASQTRASGRRSRGDQTAGVVYLVGGLVAICAGAFVSIVSGFLVVLLPLGLVAALRGGLLLGDRGLAKAAFAIGLVCGCVYLALHYLGFADLWPWSTGTLWILAGVAVVCIVVGAVHLAWTRQGSGR